MLRTVRIILLLSLLYGLPVLLFAHPVPFSFLDLRLVDRRLEGTLVVHDFDVAQELGIVPAERLMNPAVALDAAPSIRDLLTQRLELTVDGVAMKPEWSAPEILHDRQSLRFRLTYPPVSPGAIRVSADMFPYDPIHQTFVNIYEGDDLTSQAILNRLDRDMEYVTGTRQGTLAVIRRFVPEGVHHILIGPDHLLFLVGLLLLGGSTRRLLLVVSAFTLAHSITLSLAALEILNPPARIIEPAIALSIVYVGFDNILVRQGRDVRAWIAFAFGFIHGFGFANVLREMGLPSSALGWSLLSFNIGVEIGQLLVVVVVASLLAALRARSERMGKQIAFAGSVIVILAGAFWFVERVFFPDGFG